ncbi:uroporphyrinogen-III synthase [Limosilactobacillus sp. STM2_1]|uniref:Uroporphyrinogen-III synthase n=1 Tax=Limosilactobacillus rudii TaxID=2759755 RepID=A0A7W3YNN3_9LACO|nr:uroporphyrinogen-III synthase [Limosilactobacillus rudii]MBB1079441.1 uroporphyrinogen-III synthase [Limosilactobacillus rudii]MBB1097487.1 uroporphyrinogen-III synthase [Limosilactobacillus rudii]MCD7134596.1 uroporphyrinogen-III synthase [Limosilactobacillus rudii]
MAILITYPKRKVPVYWRRRLEQLTDVIYFPFRVLTPVDLLEEEKRRIIASKALVITSLYGAQTFIDGLNSLNTSAPIYVLSKKIARLLESKVTNQVVISPAENRETLLATLQENKTQKICWLIGDKAQKYYEDFIGKKIVIYRNTWDQLHENKGLKIFLKRKITMALVTSASNFDRMYEIMTKVDSNEYKRISYFTLGKSTGDYLKSKGLMVTVPEKKSEVLEKTLSNIWQAEKDR